MFGVGSCHCYHEGCFLTLSYSHIAKTNNAAGTTFPLNGPFARITGYDPLFIQPSSTLSLHEPSRNNTIMLTTSHLLRRRSILASPYPCLPTLSPLRARMANRAKTRSVPRALLRSINPLNFVHDMQITSALPPCSLLSWTRVTSFYRRVVSGTRVPAMTAASYVEW
jgi:hypothetical protein